MREAPDYGLLTAMKTKEIPPMSVISSLVTRFSAWRAYRATLRQLLQLGDRELDDIGIRRCEIPAIARRVLDHAPGHVPSHAVPRGRHVAA
jgi:uncharacterized protein YjiS (DUF1127 family)